MEDSIKIDRASNFAFVFVMVSSWIIQAAAARHTLDADGISYLNIVNRCLQGKWLAVVNGYWSPGYPVLLTFWFKLFHPSPFYEPLATKMFDVVSLVAALICFEYFLRAFLIFRGNSLSRYGVAIETCMPDSAVRVCGYGLFFWITAFLIPAHLDQPDILLFICYLIASTLLMQLVYSGRDWPRAILLGAVLGLAFLVKAVMFPLSFAFFASLCLSRARVWLVPKLIFALAAFALLSAPFIILLFHSKGRFTFGDAGPVNYRHVIAMEDEGYSEFSKPPGSDSTLLLAAAPHLQQFTSILYLGTYPPWADPSHNYVVHPFHLYFHRQLNRTHIVLRYYFELFAIQLGCAVAGFLTLLLVSGNLSNFAKQMAGQVVLWVPAVAGLALYALVRAEGRFLPGFLVGLFAAGAGALHFREFPAARRIVKSVVLSVFVLLALQAFVEIGHEAAKLLNKDHYPNWQVVSALRTLGVQPGDPVSYMGDALTDHVWAYLARVSVVAEIPQMDTEVFWASRPEEKREVLTFLATCGARVLVARNVPSNAIRDGWRKVGDTDYYLLAFSN